VDWEKKNKIKRGRKEEKLGGLADHGEISGRWGRGNVAGLARL